MCPGIQKEEGPLFTVTQTRNETLSSIQGERDSMKMQIRNEYV